MANIIPEYWPRLPDMSSRKQSKVGQMPAFSIWCARNWFTRPPCDRAQRERQHRAALANGGTPAARDKKDQGRGIGKAGEHPKKAKNGKFFTTEEGTDICFKFAASACGAGAELCPNRRSHMCQQCLKPRRNSSPSCAKRFGRSSTPAGSSSDVDRVSVEERSTRASKLPKRREAGITKRRRCLAACGDQTGQLNAFQSCERCLRKLRPVRAFPGADRAGGRRLRPGGVQWLPARLGRYSEEPPAERVISPSCRLGGALRCGTLEGAGVVWRRSKSSHLRNFPAHRRQVCGRPAKEFARTREAQEWTHQSHRIVVRSVKYESGARGCSDARGWRFC